MVMIDITLFDTDQSGIVHENGFNFNNTLVVGKMLAPWVYMRASKFVGSHIYPNQRAFVNGALLTIQGVEEVIDALVALFHIYSWFQYVCACAKNPENKKLTEVMILWLALRARTSLPDQNQPYQNGSNANGNMVETISSHTEYWRMKIENEYWKWELRSRNDNEDRWRLLTTELFCRSGEHLNSLKIVMVKERF